MEQQKTDPLAIIAFILAFLMPLVGLILGIIAYNILSKSKARGKGFAIAAIIISVGLLLLLVLFFVGIFLFVANITDSDTFVSGRCIITSEFNCEEYFITNDEVKISLRNNLDRDMYISSFVLKESGSVVCSGFVPVTLSANSIEVLSFSNCNFGDDKSFVSLLMDVKYKVEDSFIESIATGHVSGRII